MGDITYLRTGEGWLYLATVIDLAARMVIGWQLAGHMRTGLVADALDMAVGGGHAPPGAMFHSDRGAQLGFNRSSGHLDLEVGRWDDDRAGRRQRRGGPRCGLRGGRRWRGGSTGSGSGRPFALVMTVCFHAGPHSSRGR